MLEINVLSIIVLRGVDCEEHTHLHFTFFSFPLLSTVRREKEGKRENDDDFCLEDKWNFHDESVGIR